MYPSCFSWRVVSVLLLFLAIMSGVAQAAPNFVVRDLPVVAKAAAVSDNGLLAILSESDELLVYDRVTLSGALGTPRKVTVGADPQSVIFKRVADKEYFIVNCVGDSSLWLIDGRLGRSSHRMEIAAGAPKIVMAPASPECDFVYVYIPTLGTVACVYIDAAEAVARVDLLEVASRDLAHTRKYFVDRLYAATSSPDGRYLYLQTDPPVSGGVKGYELQGDQFVRFLRRVGMSGLFQISDAGYLATAGNTVTDPAYTTVKAKLAGRSILIVPDRPLILAVDGKDFVFYSTNTWNEALRAPIPAGFVPPLSDEQLEWNEARLFKEDPLKFNLFNAAYDRFGRLSDKGSPHVLAFLNRRTDSLVLINGNKLLTIPFAQLKITPEPNLHFSIEPAGDTYAMVGKPWVATLRGPDSLQYEIVESIKNAAIDGQALTLIPETSDIGPRRVTVRSSDGVATFEQSLDLIVRRPYVEVAHEPGEISVSPDGTRLLLQGNDRSFGDNVEFNTLVDLEALRVVGELKRPVSFRYSCITNELAVMTGISVYEVAVAPLDDIENIRTIKVPFTPQRVMVHNNVLHIAPWEKRSREPILRYSLPALEPLEPIQRLMEVGEEELDHTAPETGHFPERVADGFYYSGVVYEDESCTVARRIVNEFTISHGLRGDLPLRPTRWGIRARYNNDILRGDDVIMSRVHNPHVISDELPLYIEMMLDREEPLPNGHDARTRLYLNLRELNDLTSVGSIMLMDEISRERLTSARAQRVISTPRGLVVVLNRTIYFVGNDELRTIESAAPFVIRPKESVIVLEGSMNYTMEHVADNATGPVRWSLRHPSDKLSIDENTGTITLDLSAIAASMPNALTQTATRWRSKTSSDGTVWETKRLRAPPLKEMIEGYCTSNRENAERLFGRSVSEFPYSVPIWVDAIDAAGRKQSTFYVVMFEIPRAEILKHQ